jgi:aldehyde dehydrogenase (NAD+)
VSPEQRDRVEGYVRLGLDEGARLVTGGTRADDRGDGFYFEPTLFADVEPSSRLAQEEIFGPVLSVLAYDDDEHAVELANGTVYGLAAYVWGGDTGRALGVARRLRCGMVAVNGGSFIGAELPFGGRRQSGNAREWGVAGFEEFLDLKTIGVGGIGT